MSLDGDTFFLLKMADLVEEVLQQSAEKTKHFKSTDVVKNLELEFDIGNLLANDYNPVELKEYRINTEKYLLSVARDNTQLIINKIWELPVERQEDAVVAKLPEPTTNLPREKPVPKPKPLTKWEEYAKAKGIQKTKRSKLIWDEVAKDWKPRYGYRRGNDNTKDWLIEVPDNQDPYKDYFGERVKQKKERVAKNELQRLRNIARGMKMKVPGVGLTPTENPTKDQVIKAANIARVSTASLGKFDKQLPNEKPIKKTGKKRKFEPLIGNMKTEKNKNMAILDSISSKKPKLDVEKAANKQISVEDEEKKHQKKARGTPKRKKGGGKGRKGSKRSFTTKNQKQPQRKGKRGKR